MRSCASCGERNPDRARFCSGCGASLATDAAAPARTRKTVTVLFADIVDSTPLGERLDPEALQHIKARYFDETRAVLERHGGTVEKFIGDAVMAVFGIPTVHEDDALRAMRAAAEIREALERLNEDFERERGVRIATRIGVNTGEVVVGDPADGQAFATGDAVNVAARFQQAAEPGEILIGEATYRLVSEKVRAEPTQPLALKGKTGAIRAWRVGELVPDPSDFGRPATAPFVGREEQLELLQRSLARAVEQRRCELCTVVGPPGIGKSRLVRELLAGAAGQARVLVGRCLPYGEGITY